MKLAASLIFSAFVAIHFSFVQQEQERYSIGFYNVENLFDTIDHPTTIDEDFTPEGKNNWTGAKYRIKLNNLSRVITRLGENNPPALLGMAEVENKKVLEDLVKTKNLKGSKYEVIHAESKDERGIDVGAIYRTDVLSDVWYEYLEVKLSDTSDKTRDILYIRASLKGKYPFHVLFNHWPSRREGEKESEPKRIVAASAVREKIKIIRKADPNAVILILGDFNDEPSNASISKVLNAGKVTEEEKKFVNLSYPGYEKKFGTHSFKGEWNMLDQVIVNREFYAQTNGMVLADKETKIFREDWVLFKHKDGTVSPNKSYSGPVFHKSGFSDHLAVYVSLAIRP